MRIAVGQLWQETNTFNPLPTTRQDFQHLGLYRGAELVERMAQTNELGGFIGSLRGWPERPDVVGLVRLPAWPAGRADRDTFAWLRQEMLDAVAAAPPVDAVLLALHGSLAAEEAPDVEGEVLEGVRGLVGPGVPMVATLDLHANVTPKMVRYADALVLYHTAPHVDIPDTGRRGAAVLRRILVEGARPVTAFQKLPMVVPAERANTQEPASVSYGFRKRLQEIEADRRVLAAGLATVQPWMDVPELGGAVVIVADGDADLALSLCSEMAAEVWRRRREYLPELVSVADAVRIAHDNPEGLVVLSDSADSTTSGAPGDSNHVLRELLRYRWPRPVLVPLVDPQVVAEAGRLGVGAAMKPMLGGKRDTRFSKPMAVEVEVESLFDARFTLSGHLGNLSIDMGPSAVLRQGEVRVLATSRTGPHFAPDFFRTAGFDPFAAAVVVAKSPCGFRAAYQERARQILLVRAPGCAPADFWNYPYEQIDRPLWPWDEIDGWSPAPVLKN